jgi:Mn2+/Fe2+ NRAMP family transporter
VYGVAFALWELLAMPVPMGAMLAGVWSLTLLHWRGRHDEARGLEALFGFAAVLVLACAAGQLFLAVPSWSNPFFELVELAEGLLVRPKRGRFESIIRRRCAAP